MVGKGWKRVGKGREKREKVRKGGKGREKREKEGKG